MAKKESKAIQQIDHDAICDEVSSLPLDEQIEVQEWLASYKAESKKTPKYGLVELSGQKRLDPQNVHPFLASFHLQKILKTGDADLMGLFTQQMVGITWQLSEADSLNACLAAVKEIEPKDTLETMLSVQMIATHNAAMEMLRRTLLPEKSSVSVDAGVNRATKLMRTFTAQVEALNRYRGKGSEQRVVVQHVNVSEGGQAIVGNVTGEMGGKNENCVQP